MNQITDSTAIKMRNVVKSFGDVTAVNGLDLDIRSGEFFSMLGPSGSGKTTVLRLIGGFDLPTSGTIELAGVDVTYKAPFERDVNTVFQDYALFPHMSLLDNVAYGLRVRGVGKKERRERAEEALNRVELRAMHSRKPDQLSGGQRQRVAIARALVVNPKVLLLDEPLGALDLKLRQQMQIELKELQRSLAITFVFVTHDQEEALTMSDRIGVFNDGALVQLGTPREIYQNPNGVFVANFVGTSNVFHADVANEIYSRTDSFSLRPEHLRVGDAAAPRSVRGTVTAVVYLGAATHIRVRLDDGADVVVLSDSARNRTADPSIGDPITVSWDDADVVWLSGAAA
ncbi:ABC transporter ATP-binding protein [Gordonia asplenii]|uniref:ABC transporter ATP-binding protein n=1 Tax=Gordonia asplenii TaxID=2725283 RepID=UPI0028ADD564|nr:ABC transporter ATP-binding protein [Gordonia asplenii]